MYKISASKGIALSKSATESIISRNSQDGAVSKGEFGLRKISGTLKIFPEEPWERKLSISFEIILKKDTLFKDVGRESFLKKFRSQLGRKSLKES